MSWLILLSDTYDNVFPNRPENLLPIAHTTQNADIEVMVSGEGDFISSRVVTENRQTLIPCSEASASRSGKFPVAHPLHDKLQYVAGDYTAYGGEKGDTFHKDYMKALKDWCESPYANPKVCAVYKYLQKGSLIRDLVRDGTLYAQEHRLIEKWNGPKNECPPIFKVLVGNQSDAFVRFCVHHEDDESNINNLWEDKNVQQDYIHYYASQQSEPQLCYITGKMVACSTNHPSKIRNTGDKAKIISANDSTGFTYRGRFSKPEEAVQIGFEVSQKAHNALKWLIAKQGKRFGDKGERVFLLWGTKDEKLPCLTGDTVDEALLEEDFFLDDKDEVVIDTKEEVARRFNKAMMGYKANLTSNSRLAIIGLDAATTGRMAITYYKEFHGLQGNDLFDNIKAWHEQCAWIHRYKRLNKKNIVFKGSPGLEDIAHAAFGTEQNGFISAKGKVVSTVVERLIPCIVERAHVPLDIVNALVRKALHPQNYSEDYNWYKVLTITCAIYRRHRLEKSNFKEVWEVNVMEDSTDIVYNCGRLLAVADEIERYALNLQNEKRETNAMRLFTRFAAEPCSTWAIINNKLIPYKERLGNRGSKLYQLIGAISAKIDPESFLKLKNLDGRMVLGFDAQKNALRPNSKKVTGGDYDESVEEQD